MKRGGTLPTVHTMKLWGTIRDNVHRNFKANAVTCTFSPRCCFGPCVGEAAAAIQPRRIIRTVLEFLRVYFAVLVVSSL